MLYLFIAAIATCVTMIYVARRMQERPNQVQTAVEALYQLMRDNITGGNMDDQMARSGSRSSARCSCSSCSRT